MLLNKLNNVLQAFPPILFHGFNIIWKSSGDVLDPWTITLPQAHLIAPSKDLLAHIKTVTDLQELQLWFITEALHLPVCQMIRSHVNTLKYLLLDITFKNMHLSGKIHIQ